MSSQGANSGTSGLSGYQWNQVIMRDFSDWISYRKQRLIYQENQSAPERSSVSPWIPYGNDFRLSFLNGRRKCTVCTGDAFNGNGIPLPTPVS